MSELLKEKIKQKKAKIGIIGLGYVGMPLAVEFALKGYQTFGIDTDSGKIKLIHQKKNYIKDVMSKDFLYAINNGYLKVSDGYEKASDFDIVFICVPTPVTANKTPDITFIMNAATELAKRMKKHGLIVLKSTSFPGTTENYVQAAFEKRGWKVGKDFYILESLEPVKLREIPQGFRGFSSYLAEKRGPCRAHTQE